MTTTIVRGTGGVIDLVRGVIPELYGDWTVTGEDKITDGDLDTCCEVSIDSGGEETFTFDFGGIKWIYSVVFVANAANGGEVYLEYSSDGTNWTTLFDITATTKTWNTTIFAKTARYFRIRVIGGETVANVKGQMYDLRIFTFENYME